MSDIQGWTYVACPLAHARRYLAGVLPTETLQSQRLELRVPVRIPGADAALATEVMVSCAPEIDPTHESDRWHIRWIPRDQRLYPSFEGTLAIKGAEDYETCRLVIEGSYRPPLGPAGEVIDAVLGRRIAQATVDELLRTVAASMEQAFRFDESRKPGAAGRRGGAGNV